MDNISDNLRQLSEIAGALSQVTSGLNSVAAEYQTQHAVNSGIETQLGKFVGILSQLVSEGGGIDAVRGPMEASRSEVINHLDPLRSLRGRTEQDRGIVSAHAGGIALLGKAVGNIDAGHQREQEAENAIETFNEIMTTQRGRLAEVGEALQTELGALQEVVGRVATADRTLETGRKAAVSAREHTGAAGKKVADYVASQGG